MANTYPNLTKAFIRSSIGVVIFFIVAAMATGCMSTTISSGAAGVRYSPFGGTDLNTFYGEGRIPIPISHGLSSVPPSAS